MRTIILLFFLIGCMSYAAPTDSTKTNPKKPKTEKKTNVTDTLNQGKPIPKKNGEVKNSLPTISEKTIENIAIWFFVVMLVLIVLFFVQAYLRNVYLGFQSIKYIGLVIMFPGICIVALVGGNLISGETLAALLGTIAGYVLSREDDSQRDSVKALSKLKKEKDDMEAKYKVSEKALQEEIENLKKQIPG